ncbi:cytochrome c3 family protein [Pelagicoccus sp. SDUM812005]|uniref:cytochrome c3 family protein n=1 Tax=Pelagicoccus sp. SDUM812005 TaxID=3041257 RepID=UPI00280F3920|nr:cytochrome c3 family protein [Pelagicoccus sp. SDUM812005]MDQ8179797.1 cytochrome c3 family protein [Pelagicoccus sp. SDUM812005]
MNRKKLQWILAALTPLWLTFHFLASIDGEKRHAFMPDQASHGHHQIELQCSVCHTENMGVKHDACASCHQEELDRVADSHPITKFLDPRNADRVAILDARKCVSCHVEHQPDQTDSMGVTLPTDYCYFCHQDVAEERPTHLGLPFDSCSTSGCHNFHDNTALYEDFLEKHLDEPAFKLDPQLPQRQIYRNWAEQNGRQPLALAERDAPSTASYSQDIAFEWSTSSHAQAGVNCMDCHQAADSNAWVEKTNLASCQSCHDYEAETFLQSRHGMRLAQGLSPMTPAQARLPMHAGAAHKELSCTSCHSDHSFDTQFAAVDACVACHDDSHTRAYKDSKHFQLWMAEAQGKAASGTGVSCATCHLPRMEVTEFGEAVTKVLHNQNDVLRPNEKMIRPVCIQCHGVGFSIDALADPHLLDNNFQGLPSAHVESIEMVIEKLNRVAAERAK